MAALDDLLTRLVEDAVVLIREAEDHYGERPYAPLRVGAILRDDLADAGFIIVERDRVERLLAVVQACEDEDPRALARARRALRAEDLAPLDDKTRS